MPVLVSYVCNGGCRPARADRRHDDSDPKRQRYFHEYDIKKLAEIESKTISWWFPVGYDMTGFSRYQRDALFYYGIKEVADLYTKRNLWAIASLLNGIEIGAELHDALKFCLTSILLKSSRMMAHNNDGIGRIQKGTYYIPQISHDVNVLSFFREALGDMISGYEAMGDFSPVVLISTEDACKLDIQGNTIDYIFTDPPYAEKVQYGELNYVWEAWLKFNTGWLDEEIIVNETRGRTENDWARMMREAMSRCFRALKPGRCISVCYHDTSEGTWALLQDIMAEAGFVPEYLENALYIDSKTKTTNQYFADKATKRDLVLNFRKPSSGDWIIIRTVDGRTFRELAAQIIRDFLIAHPGSTKDRIYDELVSRLVRTGKMEAHDFDSLLKGVAEEVQEPVKENLFDNKEPDLFGSHVYSRWYLKETADEVDKAEQEKEDAAASRLEKHMASHLRKHPEDEGVHYSDLFEQYLPVADKPRRLLADWLPEYFVKTAAGTWRPPANEQEREQKAALRQTGILRRIKRFANALIDGVPVRDKDRPGSDRTLADWVRQCRRAGLFEQGRALYEKGGLNLDRLNETEQIEVEDDYRICVRRGGAAEAKPKRQRRKADNT